MANFRILWNFPLVSGAIIVVTGILLGILYHHSVRTDLNALAERNNVAMTRALANFVWNRIDEFVASAHELNVDALRRHPKIAEIRNLTLELLSGIPVLKVKIYNLDGLTVFSSAPSQIGQDKSGNVGFQTARGGTVASELTHRDSFSAFEQQVENRDVLSSYIPIRSADGAVRGVFEIYYDVTHLLTRIKFSQRLLILMVGITLTLLYLMILVVVRHRDRLIDNHHRERVDLIRKTIKAEESSRAKSAFLANMSHELRTPLNAIIGFTDAMRTNRLGPLDAQKYAEYLDHISVSGKHLLGLVEDILDMSRIEFGTPTLQPTETSLCSLVDECVGMVNNSAPENNPAIQVVIPTPTPIVLVDDRRFKQVLLNLLGNAIKFTPANGRITLSAVSTRSGGVEISVQDTGRGIAPGDIEKVMTPFEQSDDDVERRSAGVGLGLPLARSLIELHGGTLTLESAPGMGTRAVITLPAACVVAAHKDRAGP